MAIIGAIAHAINQHRTGKSKGLLDFFLLAVMSSFFGVMFGFLAVGLAPANEYFTMAAAGVGGWLGIESMGLIMVYINKIVKK